MGNTGISREIPGNIGKYWEIPGNSEITFAVLLALVFMSHVYASYKANIIYNNLHIPDLHLINVSLSHMVVQFLLSPHGDWCLTSGYQQ